MAFAVTNKHIGSNVEHRPAIGKTETGRLIRFEKRGRWHIALVEFPTWKSWVDRVDLYPVSEEGS